MKIKGLNYVLRVYVNIFRDTPLLVQLFLLYYGLPFIGINFSNFWCAVIGVTLNEGAFLSEIIRGYIETIPKGDWEAGESLGLHKLQVITHCIFPQAIREAVPALTGQISIIIKDTSLFSLIMITELTRISDSIYTKTFDTSGFIISAILYILIFLVLTVISHFIETAVRIKR